MTVDNRHFISFFFIYRGKKPHELLDQPNIYYKNLLKILNMQFLIVDNNYINNHDRISRNISFYEKKLITN